MWLSVKTVTVDEIYQTGYIYTLANRINSDYDEEFKPDLSPKEMLRLGVFGGNYFTEPPKEFPVDWFKDVVLSKSGKSESELNYYKINASQPLSVWQKKGWIYEEDPKGWFLWYCRYYIGRRIRSEDHRQIQRWKNMRRHISQIKKNCLIGDQNCRPRQRQALLHWAYDTRKF